MTNALITGIFGQDGSYLAELLSARGYDVWGIARNTKGTDPPATMIEAELSDLGSVEDAIARSEADEIYNFAGPSYKPSTYEDPYNTIQVGAVAVLNLLEAVRRVRPRARFVQASSSEIFGQPERTPQDETTPLRPRNPYAVAKASAHNLVAMYRDAFQLHASSAILFNHESPRRREMFVTRKVTASVARIKLGLQEKLVLGDLDARRDWGFAGDHVRGMWLMAQRDEGDDFVIGTGTTHSVRDLCSVAFAAAGIADWERFVTTDHDLKRPDETTQVVADSSKAQQLLAWKPEVDFESLVRMMVEHDLVEQARGAGLSR